MSKNDPVVYTFHGKKRADGRVREWLPGVPARSLTQSDVDRLTRKGLAGDLDASPLYRAVKAKDDGGKTDTKTEAKSAAGDAGKEG
jgi:hypothetical protein